jgi:hypothetical protein
MPENMDLTPRATSSYYNDLYPDSGGYFDGFEEDMSRDIDVDNGEEDGCDSLEEKREVHHTHQSAVKEHGSNKTLAYDNGETEIVGESPQRVLAVVNLQLTETATSVVQ